MKVITRGFSKHGGVKMQIEDWSEDYPKSFGKSATLAAYPTVKSQDGMPRFVQRVYRPGFDKMRITYQFPDAASCEAAFRHLNEGTRKFSDYRRYAEFDSAKFLTNVGLN